MTSLRRFAGSLAVLFVAGVLSASSAQELTAPVALPLTIVRDDLPIQAACVLVRRDVREHDVRLSFVTAGHLFKSADGDALPHATSISVSADGRSSLVVRPSDVSLPRGNLVDVAVFRVVVRDTALQPPC